MSSVLLQLVDNVIISDYDVLVAAKVLVCL